MNFFRRLFGNPVTEDVNQTEPLNISVNENLFRTDEDPIIENPTQVENAKPALQDILNRNFESMGFQDGYNSHRPEQLTNRLNSISAEFRMIYQSELQAIDSDILQLNSYLTENVKEHMPDQYLRIQNQLDSAKLQRIALEAELELSRKGEGYCEKAVADYRMGFEKGFALFTDEKLFTERFLIP